MSKPRFKKIVVLGVGLLGGSVALAARRKKLATQIWGWGKRAKRLAAAKRRGVVSHASADLAEACAGADLIVLCTPFTLFESTLRQVAKLAPPRCLVTDVGSVKGPWVRAWEKAAKPLQFVAAHPMAGGEQTGWEHASQRLFEGAPCIITPTPGTNKAALAKVRAFWSALGCRLHSVSPRRHDQLIGKFSHLTHALAFALSKVASQGLKPSEFELAGPSYWGNTRIAASDPGLWADIFEYNHTVLCRGVDSSIAALKRLKALKGAALRRELAAIAAAARKARP